MSQSAQVARQLKVSRRSVNEWVKNYLNLGLGGLKANMSSTNASKLDEHQKQALYQYIDQSSRSEQAINRTRHSVIYRTAVRHSLSSKLLV